MRRMEWAFPLPRPHAGIALGNGLLGALVWGRESIRVTLNRADFWDHRGAFQPIEGVSTYAHMAAAYRPEDASWFDEVFPVPPRDATMSTPSRLPFGRFELALRAGCRPVSGTLDPATGRVEIRIAGPGRAARTVLRFDLCVRRSVLWIEDPGEAVRGVRVRTAWEWVAETLRRLQFPEPVRVARRGQWGWAQGCPADPALAAVCHRADGGYVVALERGADAAAALVAAVRAATSSPILAAGGVDGPSSVQSLLRAGASAVAVGTLLLRTDESGASETHKRALGSSLFSSTSITRAFTGRPARALRNGFVERHDAAAITAYPAVHHLTRELRRCAGLAGDSDRLHLWAGTGFRAARTGPAGDVLRALAAGL